MYRTALRHQRSDYSQDIEIFKHYCIYRYFHGWKHRHICFSTAHLRILRSAPLLCSCIHPDRQEYLCNETYNGIFTLEFNINFTCFSNTKEDKWSCLKPNHLSNKCSCFLWGWWKGGGSYLVSRESVIIRHWVWRVRSAIWGFITRLSG